MVPKPSAARTALSAKLVQQHLNNTCALCPVCGDLTSYAFPRDACSFSKRVSDRQFFSGDTFGASIQKCLNCGHLHVWPLLTQDQLADLYANRYSRQAPSAHAMERAKSQWQFFERHLPPSFDLSSSLKVVELGCSYGHLLAHFSFSSKLVCYEPDPDHSAEALKDRNRVEIVRSVVIGDELEDDSVDFWIGSHSLEHIADPHLLFQAAQKKIRVGRFMFQEFPTSQGDEAYPKGDVIGNFHLNWFTQSSITLLASRYGFVPMGLQFVEGVRPVSNGDIGDTNFNRYIKARVIRILFQLVHKADGLPRHN